MTDPRYSDQHSDQRLSDPVLRQDDERMRGIWAWIAGLAVLGLIAFVVVTGWNSDRDTASTNPSAPTSTSSAPVRSVTPPSTTGSGATSPRPAAPAPANRGQ